jgi:hypothetical protein
MDGSGSVQIITDPVREAQKLMNPTDPDPEHCFEESRLGFKSATHPKLSLVIMAK